MTCQTPIPEIYSENYRFLQEHVYSQSGIVLEGDKHYLFESRLAPIVRQLGLGSINDLCALLRATREIQVGRQVVEAMTTNETYFFRDPAHYDAIRSVLLPKLKEERRDYRRLRFWSAAASTGQEAYSLAMLLLEHFPMLVGWNIVIEGTDICHEVVQRAQAGRYHRIEMNRGLPARYVVRYFDHIGEDWIVKPEVRKLSNFRQANLCGPSLPFHRATDHFDVIFLRNVMLYFDQPTRRTLMAGVHHLLAPDGLLFLGSSEQPADPSIWTPVLAGGTCYFRPRQPS
jgi:chemotaxis protein methyltransferase CheR